MKITELLQKNNDVAFSFEIIPPPRGRSIADVIEMVEMLMPANPRWFDVTSHASSAYVQEDRSGNLRRRTFRKRPGTLGICGVIQNRFKVDTVAHILCLGFTREETEDALIELNYLGVENILAIRGDNPNYEKKISKDKSVNAFAGDLVRQAKELREGKFLDELADCAHLDFCVGVAGYPEKHFEAANLDLDIQYLKAKVEAGADYIVTQMFFDNAKFFDFVKRCREAGITIPIIPGMKILKSLPQLRSIPRTFHIDLPSALVDEMMQNPAHTQEIGARWTTKQIEELIAHGHSNIHLYVMNDAHLVRKVVEKIS